MKLCDPISGIAGWERPGPPTNDVRTLSEGIDSYFDGLLWTGMSSEQARWVEAERERAHAALRAEIFAEVLKW